MPTNPQPADIPAPKRQGRLLAFGMTGAMALALSACDSNRSTAAPMIAPPRDFTTNQASYLFSTNYPPNSPYIYSATGSSGGGGSYLTSHGYYRIYGYPGYYYRPAPGSTVELVQGGSSTYRAGSAAEADETAARGGFGEHGEGHGSGGEGHGGGGEGGGHGGGE